MNQGDKLVERCSRPSSRNIGFIDFTRFLFFFPPIQTYNFEKSVGKHNLRNRSTLSLSLFLYLVQYTLVTSLFQRSLLFSIRYDQSRCPPFHSNLRGANRSDEYSGEDTHVPRTTQRSAKEIEIE